MPASTEICTLNLVAGSEIGDPNNQASAVMKESGDTLASLDTMQQMQFGMQIEHPELLSLFINWDKKTDHDAFMASDGYQSFYKRFSTIFTGEPDVVHVDLQPEGGLTAALSAPVTEVATFYFDGGPPDNAIQGVEKCMEALKKEGHNIYGWSYGTTYETIERDGAKGKGTVLTIGWDSVEAHMEARKGQAFKETAPGMRNGAKAIEVHHIQFMQFQA